MVSEISNSIRMGHAALFSLSLHLLSGKFEPAVALAAAGSLFLQGEPLLDGQRWCDAECRDTWQAEQKVRA